jgi:hypothetical protein
MIGRRRYWYLQMAAAFLKVVLFDASDVASFSVVGSTTTATTAAIAGNRLLSLLASTYAAPTTTTTTAPLGKGRFHSSSHDDKKHSSSTRLSRHYPAQSSSSTALTMISRQSMEQLGIFLGIMTILQRRALWKAICHQYAYMQTLSRSNQLLMVVASCTAVYAAIVKPFWSWYKATSSLPEKDADDVDNKDTSIVG